MAPLPTKPSTPRLSEAARHLKIPSGIVTTGWPAVEAKAAEVGIEYDWWQKAAGRITLGKRADGKYAATVGGVVWSVPRQVGKTFTVGSMLVMLCLIFPKLKVVWTAHRTRTCTNTFRAMQSLVKSGKIAPHVANIRVANGEQEITFKNGSVIMFGAREQGFGRGIDEVDIEVFDEAQILTIRALEDMVAATNQARNPHGALLFFIGTPPRPIDPGEAFADKRRQALDGEDDLFYLELAADDDADPDDRKQWAKANLSYPKRTPLESMRRLRKNLPSVEAWKREALGIWDQAAESLVMPAWPDCYTELEPSRPASIAIAVSVDRAWSSIGACSTQGHLGSVLRARGTDWVVAEAQRIQSEYRIPVIIAGRGPAASLIDPLTEAGVDIVVADVNDYQTACADLFDRVATGSVSHGNYDDLNDAVAAAAWTTGDRRVWTRKKADVSMLEAVTLALWGSNQLVDAEPSAFYL